MNATYSVQHDHHELERESSMKDQTASDHPLGNRRSRALGLLVTAQFITVLDAAIVNVALPSIQHDLGFTTENLQWVVTAYIVVLGGMLLLGGRLSDLLGRRNIFTAGLGLFTAASLFNGLAWNQGSLIAGRAGQGLGAALLTPAALSLLVTIFPEGRERNRALGIWGGAVAAGASMGNLVGGVLTDGLSWPWIFFINVPIGLVVVLLAPRYLPESRNPGSGVRFDAAGAVSVTAGLGTLIYGTTYAAEHGWGGASTIGLLATAAALLGGFLAIESRSRSALLPLRVFRLRTLSGSNLASLFNAPAAYLAAFLPTLYMQEVLGYSAVTTGAAFVATSFATIVTAGIVQSQVSRVGVKPLIIGGLLVDAAAMALLARVPANGSYWTNLFPAFVASGIGIGLVYVAAQVGAQMGIKSEDAGVASGLIQTTGYVGGAIGIAIATTLASTSSHSFSIAHPAATVAASVTHGFQTAFWVFSGAMLVGAALSALLLERRGSSAPQPVGEPILLA